MANATKTDFLAAMGGATVAVGALKTFTAASGNKVTMTSHGLVDFTGPVRVAPQGGASLPGGLAAATDYWLLVVDANTVQFCSSAANAVAGVVIDLTSTGSGTIDLTRAAFQEDFLEAGVNVGTDVLTLTAHGVATGFGPVVFTVPGGGGSAALPAGLALATNYWLIVTGVNTVKVASSLANALAGTAIDITDDGNPGGGTFRCAAGAITDTFANTDVTITNGGITCTGHGKDTGYGPVRLTTSGALPAPLATATNYWFIVVDANTLQLATSKANAIAGIFVNIQDAGSGTNQMRATMQTVADQMEQCLDEVLCFPGYRDMPKDVNVNKFWVEAVQGAGFPA